MRSLILILAFIPNILFSQTNSTRLDFYPLQIGNEWTYQSYSWEYSATGIDTISMDTVTCRVTGDTLMSNGKKYYHISGVSGGYRRVDSLSQKVYECDISNEVSGEEYVWLDLSIVDSSNWIDGLGNYVEIQTSTDEEPVGYMNEKAIQTIYSGRYFFHCQVLSQGFGLSRLHFGCMLPETVHILIKAKIGGIENKSYFPMQTGNKWIFQRNENEPYNTYFILSIEDSLLYENQVYWRFSPYLFYRSDYYRIDSLGNFLQLHNDKPILNFNMQVGDSIQIGNYPAYSDSGYTFCVGRKNVTTFTGTQGEQIAFFVDWYLSVIDEADEIILQEGVGPVGLSFTQHDRPMILRGVVLNGIVYGDTTTTSVIKNKIESKIDFNLSQNYPNPFNSSTEIGYSIPQGRYSQKVQINIYDICGRLVRMLANENQPAGNHSVKWDGKNFRGNDVSSGIYFYALQVGDYKMTKKMLLIE